ncbi:MAG: hypothetical protein ACREOO_11040 [bacterium]
MKKIRSTLRIAFSFVLLLVIVYVIAIAGKGCGSFDQAPHKPVWKTGAMPAPKESEVAVQSLIVA